MDWREFVEELKKALNFPPGLIPSPTYSNVRRQLAKLCLHNGEEISGIYHLTESHGIGLRQTGVSLSVKSSDSWPYYDYLSFENGYSKDESQGMLRRLREMPSEWTIVQLTREFDEPYQMREAQTSPGLKRFHLTRLPCGSVLNEIGCPITVKREWPSGDCASDLINTFLKIKSKLGKNNGASSSMIRKMRNDAASEVEIYCREIGPVCLKEWLVLFLGTLCDTSVSKWIRNKVDQVLNTKESLTRRQRYLTYLIAEGVAHLSEDEISSALFQLYPGDDDEEFQFKIEDIFTEIQKEKPNLALIRRNPVILIVDEHLDLIPWESLVTLRRHPISRVPSLHFAHALFKIHCKSIKYGLRELDSKDVCYYVVNPGGDSNLVDKRLINFLKKRFPSWIGFVDQKPTQEQLIEALTNGNAYIYCGHGSGCQYLPADAIQRLKVKPVQLLFGCSSVALKDHGGSVEMTGDFLQYAVAGSGCTLGMLYPVTSRDVDQMTLHLANIWLPGEALDVDSLKPTEDVKKEPELLRALLEVRKAANLYSNGAGFIARGIPVKIV